LPQLRSEGGEPSAPATPGLILLSYTTPWDVADGTHLNIAVANGRGTVIGGHICTGSLVRTTAELVVGLLSDCHFGRELGSATGYAELAIKDEHFKAA